jgi:hypothetical protein
MTLVHVVPKLGALPQLDTYRCTGCGDVQTIERPSKPSEPKEPPVAV